MSNSPDSSNKNTGSPKTTRMLRAGDGGHINPNPTPLAIPELVSPINNQHFPPYPRTLNLAWKAVPGATGYVVTLQFYSNTPQGKTWLAKPPFTVTGTSMMVDFPANVPGRWCISAVDSTGAHTTSPDSSWGTFDFTVLILDTPTLVSPVDGQVFSNYPRRTALSWKPVGGATGYFVTVDCCLDRQVSPASKWQNVLKGTVQDTSLTFDFVGAQPGRWSVMAIDNTNGHQQSATTSWRNFSYTI
jgi:hypothetical protein